MLILNSSRVAELNAYTPVTVHPSKSLTEDLSQLSQYQVVVLTGASLKDQLAISEYCHKNGIFVVIADIFGLFGSIFTDFGEKFACVDPTGENPLSGIVAGIGRSFRSSFCPFHNVSCVIAQRLPESGNTDPEIYYRHRRSGLSVGRDTPWSRRWRLCNIFGSAG